MALARLNRPDEARRELLILLGTYPSFAEREQARVMLEKLSAK